MRACVCSFIFSFYVCTVYTPIVLVLTLDISDHTHRGIFHCVTAVIIPSAGAAPSSTGHFGLCL